MKGKGFRNVKLFGKMDPYVVFDYRKIKYKTEPDVDGHTEPTWN